MQFHHINTNARLDFVTDFFKKVVYQTQQEWNAILTRHVDMCTLFLGML